jgi:hypothetical protein
MKKLFVLSVILILVVPLIFLLSSCSEEDPVQTPTTGTIQGKVTNSTGDSVIVGATVSTNPPTSSVTTNSSGDYSIPDVSPGQYSVTATKVGYNPTTVLITVSAGKTTTANISLNLNTTQQGLVAYYPFNGNANDESGNGNNGTVNGALITNDRFGNSNQAYSFNGISNYINIPDNQNFHTLNSITISTWFKSLDSTNYWAKLVAKHYDASSGSFYIVWEHNYIRFSAITNFQYAGINSGNIIDGEWHHACGVYDGTTMYLYIDGILINSSPNNGSIKETNYPVTIANSERWNEYYQGSIDDIRIYNRALTYDEIQTLYHEGGWQNQNIVIPLELANWKCYVFEHVNVGNIIPRYVSPSPGVFEKVSDGLKVYGSGYRNGALIHYVPTSSYPIVNKTIYLKWKANGGGNFMGTGVWLFPDTLDFNSTASIRAYITNLSTHNSYAGSYQITDDVWYFTRVVVTSTNYMCTTSYNNYDNHGGTVVQNQTGTLDRIYRFPILGLWDTYAGTTAYAILGEARIE